MNQVIPIRTYVAIDSTVLGTLGKVFTTKQEILNVIHLTCLKNLPKARVEITELREVKENG